MLNFDYYYSNPKQNYYFSFNTLFSDAFKSLSVEAKALYALMLERSNLSNKNNWLDSENKVYIIFTSKHVMDYFQCSERTALKLLKELDEFGLIERHRTKIGQPYIIYVKLYHITNDTICDAQPNISEKETDKIQSTNFDLLEKPERSKCANTQEFINKKIAYQKALDKMQKKASEGMPIKPPAKNDVSTCKICSQVTLILVT